MKTISSIVIVLCAGTLLFAQQSRSVSARKPPSNQPPSTSDFFVSEAKVDVTRDETVVRLAMAQHGSVLIELPANDGPRYIIPGDPEVATVDEKALERNKRAIVVRPGTQFLAPLRKAKARVPTATVTAQMKSGLVVTFLFYPVSDLAQNVHRCVLSYNRDEVVARRSAAGLPVNLDMESRGEMTGQPTAPRPTTDLQLQKLESSIKTEVVNSLLEIPTREDNAAALSPPQVQETAISDEVIARTREALQQALKNSKQFKHWTKPVHGLALSFTVQPIPSSDCTLALVAVRNTTFELLKLSSEAPDLFIEMTDEQGNSMNVERVTKIHVERSDPDDHISSKGLFYYAIAFPRPLLGTHQRLRLTISHINAVDEPASVLIPNSR